MIYGSTEAEPISHIDGLELANHKGELNPGLPVGKIDGDTEVVVIQIKSEAIGEIEFCRL